MFIDYYYYYYCSKVNKLIPDKNNVSLYIHTTCETYFRFEKTAMEYRPNSWPDRSRPLQSDTIIWQGPKYLIFDTKDSRLKSYVHWPHGMNPSSESLSEVGFYYTGIYIITISVSLVESLSSSLHTTLYLQVKVMEQYAFTVAEG